DRVGSKVIPSIFMLVVLRRVEFLMESSGDARSVLDDLENKMNSVLDRENCKPDFSDHL
ncbi:hypothetical protein KPH14_012687, partial [Odynerus spinipes]